MMTERAAYELTNRSAWACFTRMNRLATEARQGAVSGDLNAIARFIVLADQAWDAQRRIYGLRGSVDVG